MKNTKKAQEEEDINWEDPQGTFKSLKKRKAVKNLSLKKTAQEDQPKKLTPKIEEETEEFNQPPESLPTSYKQRKIAPPGLMGVEPNAPTPEMSQTFQELFNALQTIQGIDNTIDQARQKLQQEIEQARKAGGYDEALAKKQQAIDKLAYLMEEAENNLVRFGDTLAYLNTATKERQVTLTAAKKLKILMDAFGAKAERLLAEAEAKATAALEPQERVEEVRELSTYPYREKTSKIAQFEIDEIANIMTTMNEFIDFISSATRAANEISQELS